MSVSAIVVSHGHARELETLVPVLEPQVDEVVVVANTPGSTPSDLPAERPGARERPSAPARGERQPRRCGDGPVSGCVYSNPDVMPAPDAVGALHGFASTRPRCGIAGPRTVWPDGRWQPTRRSFPTVSGTLVRRTPLRRLFPPLERQTAHYHLDEDVDEPVEADWLLGAFLLLRREILAEIGGFDEGFRHYVEDIDLCYRAMRAGWERWYVPGGARHARLGAGDRQGVPLTELPLARTEHGPLRPQAPRDAGAAVTREEGAVCAQGRGLDGRRVRGRPAPTSTTAPS